MLTECEINDAINDIAELGKPALIDALRHYDAQFPIDFTDEFLAKQDEERLRHIFVALVLHCQKMPRVKNKRAA